MNASLPPTLPLILVVKVMSTNPTSVVARLRIGAALVALIWALAHGTTALACPFCSVASQTLSEELAAAEVAVIAKLVKVATLADDPAGLGTVIDSDSGKAQFEIIDVLHGEEHAAGLKQIGVVYFGEDEEEKSFLISGATGPSIDWTTPLPLSVRAVDYVKQLGSLAPKGPDRLKFFSRYFEDRDPLLAQDAYDEFSRAPYDEILRMADHLGRQRLTAWIEDSEVGPTRRRLYLTLLGVCGQADDIAMLESLLRYDYQQMKPGIAVMVAQAGLHGSAAGVTMVDELIRADVRRKRQCLDALIAAYLRLKGPAGMPLVEQLFLTNPAAEYTHVYATIMALRFHGEESDVIPRERLQQALRLVLDNPEIADQVITDLARWEDWSILDRLVNMFKTSEEDAWIRQPVISYLLVAEDQPEDVGKRATAALAELEQLDPKGVKRARSYAAFGLLARPDTKEASTENSKQDATAEKTEQELADGEDQVEGGPATSESTEPGPNRWMIVGIPLVSGLLLMGVFALLLRGSDIRSSTDGS